jgi:hypothetical protein
MTRLQDDIDALDRMVDGGSPKDAIRSQIRLIEGQVTALEADYARLSGDHTELQAAHTKLQAAQQTPPAEVPAEVCPFCRKRTAQLIQIKPSPIATLASIGAKQGYYHCSNGRCCKNFDKPLPAMS